MSERFDDSIQIGVEFLLVDLDLAMTFMDVAAASRLEDPKHRNHKNARQAFDTFLHLLEKLKPDAGQRRVIDAKLARLKTRLEPVGQQVLKKDAFWNVGPIPWLYHALTVT